MLVTPEQLPEVLASLRGDGPPASFSSNASQAPQPSAAGGSSRDAVAEMMSRYPEDDGPSDEDAWQLTGRE